MTTRIGIGRSRSRDSRAAALEVAREALAALDGRPASMVLLFSTMGHDQRELVRAVRGATAGAPLVGCSAEGIISRHGSEEQSHAAVAAAIASDEITLLNFFAPGFSEDSAACARALAREIRASGKTDGLVILFPDGLTGNCRELIDTLETELPRATIIGGTAGDTLTFEKTCQFHDDRVASGGVAALVVSGADFEIAVTHGSRLIGTERRVTRTDGGFVCEIDGEPAWDFFKSYLPDGPDSLEAMHVAHLLMAERVPTPDPAFGDFTVRVPVKLDPTTKALYFAAGVPTGTRVQLAIRDPQAVCQRAIATAERIRTRRPDQQPLLVLQLDCAGRGALLFGDDTTAQLIRPVQDVLGENVPWLGLHTYGEIAPVGGKTYFHNYTAVLCAFYPRRPAESP